LTFSSFFINIILSEFTENLSVPDLMPTQGLRSADMPNLQEHVDHYIAQLTGKNAFSALHSLIQAGPAALPVVVEAFNATDDPHVKISLVQLVSEYRSSEAVPFLRAALSDRNVDIWRAALDGLVILGSRAALEALRTARLSARAEQKAWIHDAIVQINEDAV
jgi:hypothetical protein